MARLTPGDSAGGSERKDPTMQQQGTPMAGHHSQRHWLWIISVLLALLVAGVWSKDAPVTAWGQEKPTKATTPPVSVDLAVAQRYDMIGQLAQVNSKLDRIGDLLASGQVKVIVQQDDKKAEEVRHEATSKP
jgi:hypothetical protein